MFILLIGCVIALYYYDKYFIQKKKWSINEKETVNEEMKKPVVENDYVTIEEVELEEVVKESKFETIKEEMENLGFKEKNDLEKLKKQWKNITHFKIPLFIVVSLFIFPGALLFVPVYFAINYVTVKTRINYLERRK